MACESTSALPCAFPTFGRDAVFDGMLKRDRKDCWIWSDGTVETSVCDAPSRDVWSFRQQTHFVEVPIDFVVGAKELDLVWVLTAHDRGRYASAQSSNGDVVLVPLKDWQLWLAKQPIGATWPASESPRLQATAARLFARQAGLEEMVSGFPRP